MKRIFSRWMVALLLLASIGCASTAESVNQGARDAGRPAGSVMRLPGSVMEGAGQGMAGQPTPNPYGR